MSDEQALTIAKPAMGLTDFKQTHKDLLKFVNEQLREAKDISKGDTGDYGVIPYTKKKSLLKPGAEKLLALFGYAASNELVKEVEDWDKRFVYYKYKCTITHKATGTFIADATRSCNNKEKKHATKDVYDVANTVESIAQKRALVAATIQATMASEIFKLDESDHDDTAPEKATTRDEDPGRVKAIRSYFGTASQRGFTSTRAETLAEKKFNVDSMKKITTNQIKSLTDALVLNYEIVAEGEAPKRMVSQTEKDKAFVDNLNADLQSNQAKTAMFKEAAAKHVDNSSLAKTEPAEDGFSTMLHSELNADSTGQTTIDGEIVEPEEEKKPKCIVCFKKPQDKDKMCLTDWALAKHKGSAQPALV